MSRRSPIAEGWQLARLPAGACADPIALERYAPAWRIASVPGTAAGAGAEGGPGREDDFDAWDWWYRVRFDAPERRGVRQWLRLEGLATLATAWLNGEPILESRNMFRRHRVEVTPRLRETNDLLIRFSALAAHPVPRRPRARWKTALVSNPDLRWFRTTLLGRMPGWTPQRPPVGPWRPVELECAEDFDVEALELRPIVTAGRARLRLEAAIGSLGGAPIEAARLRLGSKMHELRLAFPSPRAMLLDEIDAGHVPRWWPHTHGEPALVDWELELARGGEWRRVDSGRVGFRSLELDDSEGGVAFRVNGVPVFCRGWCWSPVDPVSPHATREALRAALEPVRDAGANMLRVGGTMAYEADDFYALCDELGILVWQDFMFANMDYPFGDPAFRAEAEAEAGEVVGRLARHASIAAWCGGSEVAQQAAMLGLPPEHWTNEFSAARLREIVRERHGAPYFPSTPWGGALPFHVGEGIAHYYGVGAYRRPLADAKAARVRFATECLAFSHMPDPETLEREFGKAAPPPHDPRWKAGVPRDNGAGWDFEDVRDHYLRELFDVDPVALRSRDLSRYHALSRAVTGEIVRRVFAEWRAGWSACGGALVWLLRDLVPGAGWGSVDALGMPKAVWWHLRRAWAPRSLHLTDEGLDGLAIHVVNEAAHLLEARVELELLRDARVAIARAEAAVRVEARGVATVWADALLGRFTDIAHAYRFGPPSHDVCAVRLVAEDGTVISEDFHFACGMHLAPIAATIEARVEWDRAGGVLALSSDAFLQGVRIACPGFAVGDNHFHLVPRREKRVELARLDPRADGAILIEALNLASPVVIPARAPSGAANTPSTAGSNLLGGAPVPRPEVRR